MYKTPNQKSLRMKYRPTSCSLHPAVSCQTKLSWMWHGNHKLPKILSSLECSGTVNVKRGRRGTFEVLSLDPSWTQLWTRGMSSKGVGRARDPDKAGTGSRSGTWQLRRAVRGLPGCRMGAVRVAAAEGLTGAVGLSGAPQLNVIRLGTGNVSILPPGARSRPSLTVAWQIHVTATR